MLRFLGGWKKFWASETVVFADMLVLVVGRLSRDSWLLGALAFSPLLWR